MRIRRSLAPILVACLLALGALGGLAGAPPDARAADGRTDTATSTYTLDPAQGVISVAVDYRVTNTTPNVASQGICIKYYLNPPYPPVPYTATCTGTSRSYWHTATVWVEADATNIKVTADTGSVTVKKAAPDELFRRLDLSFANVYYKQTRTLHVTYTLPGGKPRSSNFTRALMAYTNFCAVSHGYDSGVVRIRVPASYQVDLTGSPLTASETGATTIYSSGTISKPLDWWACVEGVNNAGYETRQLTGADGRTVFLESWPEDAEWTAAVQEDLLSDVPKLVGLIGEPVDGSAPLVIKETVTGAEYAGFYDPSTNTITVDEDFSQPGLVGHELAHMWFNDHLFRDTWLSEGYAEWAGRKVESGCAACARPVAPSASRPALSSWQYLNPKSSDDERAAVDYQYDASCYLVTQVAAAAGDQGMTTAMVALLNGQDPYAVDPSATGSASPAAASWHQWLDAIDELALYPAGASPDLVSDLLLEFGATSASTELGERSDARAAYHALQQAVSSWTVPEAVRAPLREWRFGDARIAINAAQAAWTITGTTDRILAGVDARRGPAADAWARATSADDLDAAAALARQQLDAATEVADGMKLAGAPRDFVQELGLLGATVPSLDPAVEAVRTMHTDDAMRLAASVRGVLGEARSAGEMRLVIGGFVIAGGVLLLLVVLIRRPRRRLAAMTAAGPAAPATEPAAPAADGFIGPVLGDGFIGPMIPEAAIETASGDPVDRAAALELPAHPEPPPPR